MLLRPLQRGGYMRETRYDHCRLSFGAANRHMPDRYVVPDREYVF